MASDRLIAEPDRVFEWISARSGLVRVADFIGIAREVDGQIVAAFGYDFHQDASCMFHAASEPGGINLTLLRRGFWVPFVQWGYGALMGVVQHGNLASREHAARLGFTERLVIPEAHPSGGLHWFTMTRRECPWLTENKNNVRRRQCTQSSRPERSDQ